MHQCSPLNTICTQSNTAICVIVDAIKIFLLKKSKFGSMEYNGSKCIWVRALTILS